MSGGSVKADPRPGPGPISKQAVSSLETESVAAKAEAADKRGAEKCEPGEIEKARPELDDQGAHQHGTDAKASIAKGVKEEGERGLVKVSVQSRGGLRVRVKIEARDEAGDSPAARCQDRGRDRYGEELC